MTTKNSPAGPFDGYAKAKDDEPMFTLLGRDQSGALLVRLWALMRHHRMEDGARPPEDAEKIAEALKCADAMEAYCKSVGREPINDLTASTVLLMATKGLKEHPEDYNHACACDLCLSYAAEDGDSDGPAHIPGVSPQPNSF